MIAKRNPSDGALGTTASIFRGVRLSSRVTAASHATQGGDWCEAFVLSDTVVALSIGDVVGHGPGAVATRLLASRAVRDAASYGLNPAESLAAANRLLCNLDPEIYATAFFALLDTRRGIVSFANAGHPPPLIVGPAGSWFLSYGKPDLPLGLKGESLATVRVARMPARTLLVLYTDGVTDHERRPLLGEAQLHEAALLAYESSARHAAPAIEELMALTAANADDAAILTAWMPRTRIAPARPF